MNQKLFCSVVALAGLAGCVVAPAPYGRPYYVESNYAGDYYGEAVLVAPPPPPYEYVGVPPAVDLIWIGGFWNWTGHDHVWVPGHWDRARPGYVWAPHRWEHDGERWRLSGGRWVPSAGLPPPPVRAEPGAPGSGMHGGERPAPPERPLPPLSRPFDQRGSPQAAPPPAPPERPLPPVSRSFDQRGSGGPPAAPPPAYRPEFRGPETRGGATQEAPRVFERQGGSPQAAPPPTPQSVPDFRQRDARDRGARRQEHEDRR